MLLFLSSASKLKETIEVETFGASNTYQNLLQYVLPTPTTTVSCSYFQNKIAEYDLAYNEIDGLSSYQCLKSILDSMYSQLQQIVNNGSCAQDSSSTSNSSTTDTIKGASQPGNITTVGNESILTGLANDLRIVVFQNGSRKGRRQVDPVGTYFYVDRKMTFDGFMYLGIIGVSGSDTTWNGQVILSYITFYNPVNEAFGTSYMKSQLHLYELDSDRVPKADQAQFNYVRIGPKDETLWGIDFNGYVYSMTGGFSTYKDFVYRWVKESSEIQLAELDPSPKDGSVIGVKTDGSVWYTSGPNAGWTQIQGLVATHVRVISNGNVFGLGKDGNIYFLSSYNSNWQVLSGQNGFIWFDVNNNGLLIAVKKGDYRAWTTNYVSQQWTDEKMHFHDVKVTDSNNIIGISLGTDSSMTAAGTYYLTSFNFWDQIVDGGLLSVWGSSNHVCSGDAVLLSCKTVY